MGTFAETANVDYSLSFADQGKQTSVSILYIETAAYIYRCRSKNIYVNI
jgi:hypothetical protein